MKTVFKRVFYCDFCKEHRLRSDAMERHERGCTLNPDRDCWWLTDGKMHKFDVAAIADALKEREPLDSYDIDWLENQVKSCPACMLSAIRLGGIKTDKFNYAEFRDEMYRRDALAASLDN